jgi:hypothetical protein
MMLNDGGNRQAGVPEGSAARLLADRLDAISALIDKGPLWEAREALSGRRWLSGIDVTDMPDQLLRRAQQWVDAAHDELRTSSPDANLAHHVLLQARRLFEV